VSHILHAYGSAPHYLLLRADYAVVQDKSFKKHVQAYAADEALFFKE
jgi:hypothetical protein